MAEPTFPEFIAKERERLRKERAKLLEQQQTLVKRLAEIDRELKAVDAYETVKYGKPAASTALKVPATAPRRKRAKAKPATTEVNKGEHIMQLIAQSPAGLTRGDLIETLGVKGNKVAEQSVSNSLANLKRKKRISSNDGKYVVP